MTALLDGTVVLVTGGSGRIGAALARRLARRRCLLLLHHCSTGKERLEELTEELHSLGAQGVEWFQADFSTPGGAATLARKLESFPPPFALVNSAGSWLRKPLAEISWEEWVRVYSINTVSPAILTAALASRGVKRVVNVTDIAWEKGWKNSSAYSASKAALVSLTRSAAAELAPRVAVNAVAPGLITVPEGEQERFRPVIQRIPAGRTGEPDEVAQVIELVLLAPDYVTGQILSVDGAASIR